MSLTTARVDEAAAVQPDVLPRRRQPPERMCIGCRARRPKSSLLRVAVAPGGRLMLDETGKGAGRGAYLCRQGSCWRVKGLARRVGSALRRSLTIGDQAWLAATAARWGEDSSADVDGG